MPSWPAFNSIVPGDQVIGVILIFPILVLGTFLFLARKTLPAHR